METLFLNAHSDVPDDLWKAASPAERQLAAVHFWAETTKVGGATDSVRKTVRETLLKEGRPELIAGLTAGTLGAVYSALQSRKTPSGKTQEQNALAAERARLQELERQDGKQRKISGKIQDLKERIAAGRAENPVTAAGISALTSGLLSSVLTRRALRQAANASS